MKYVNRYGKFARTFKNSLLNQSFYFFVLLALSLNSCSEVCVRSTFVEVGAKSALPFKHMSGSVKYGFGICKSDNKIAEMSFKPDYREIENFKLFLKKNGHSNIERFVASIERSIKSGSSATYATAIDEYNTEIEKLKDPGDLFDQYARFQVTGK